jgi:hypothetical protein
MATHTTTMFVTPNTRAARLSCDARGRQPASLSQRVTTMIIPAPYSIP